MKKAICLVLCFAMVLANSIAVLATEELSERAAGQEVPGTINAALASSAVNCLYEDKWVPMFPTGAPDNSTTWPDWNEESNYAEIIEDGYQDLGALHFRSSVYKNVGVAINVGMTPGEVYTLGLWAKGTAQSQSLFSYGNGDFPIVETAEALSTNWQYYEVTFTAQLSQINLCCRDWGSNDVYVDNVTLKDSNGNDLLAGNGNFYKTVVDQSFDANLNFEDGSGSQIDNWKHRAVVAEGSMTAETDRVYSGNRAMRVTRENGKIDVSFVNSTALIPVSPGDRIEIIAHIASRNSVSGHFSMYLDAFGKAGAEESLPGVYGQERIIHAGSEWSQWDTYEMTYIVGSGVYYIRIGMRIGGTNADVLIDDLQYYNYTENNNTVYTEDFEAPSVATGLPGGWNQNVRNGQVNFDGTMSIAATGTNRLYTELFCLNTDYQYTLDTTAKVDGGASAKIILEAVDWKDDICESTEISLTTGTISEPFTAHSAAYYRLWVITEGEGTVSLEDISIQRNGKTEKNTNHFQSVGFRFPTGTLTAGQEITVTGNLKLSDTMPAEDALQVGFVQSGKELCVGKLCLTEGKTTDMWPVGSSFQAEFCLKIPEILPTGNYTVVLKNTGGTIGLVKVSRENQPITTASSIQSVNGKPTLFVNGQAQVPLWYARPENPDLYEAHTVTKFAEAGIDTVVTYVFLNNNYGDVWTPNGFVHQAVDDMMWATLSGNPDAKLIVTLDVNAPKWWLDAHPEELATLENTTPDRTGASFASDLWKQESGAIMVEVIEYLMTQPYANNIVGFKVTGGYTLEWNWWALSGSNTDVGDFSECGIHAFRAWLKNKYQTDEALQQAYSDHTITLENAMPPSASLRQEQTDSSVLTVQDHPQMMDYEMYMAELKADTIEYFAAAAKDAVNDRLVVGTYGGYFYMGGGYEFSSSTANVYFQKLLQSENIDFIKSPWMYGLREIGDSGEFMGPVDSAALYGKLWIAEEDSRLNLQEMQEKQDDKSAVGWTRDYQQSLEQLKRNFAYALSKGAGMSFYNLMWNFTDDDQYYGVIQQMYQEMAETISRPENNVADIAVFVDGESNMLIPFEDRLVNSILHVSVYREQLKELGHIGAAYDTYLLDDLKDGLVPEHKINIFLGTTWISQVERDAIAQQLQKNGNILVWLFTDGISDGTVTDIGLLEELTGMDLSILNTQRKHIAAAVLENTDHWLTTGLRVGNSYGVETYEKMSPVIAITDRTATVLAYHVADNNGVSASHGALAVKDMGDWVSVYSAIPNIPQGIIRNMLSYVDCHIYTDSGSDVIHASTDHIALHSVFAGTRTIRIPEGYGVYDVFHGEAVPVENGEISVTLNGAETRLFRLTEIAQEKSWLDDTMMTGAYTAYPGQWVPMYPTGTPEEGSTWPAWSRDSHYGEIVDEGHNDIGSLFLKSSSFKNTGVAIDAGMTPGQQYTLGLWAKGMSNAGRVLALYANEGAVIIGTSQDLNEDWTYYEVTFTADIRQLNILAADWGETSVYIDNITLKDSSGVDLLAGYGDFWQKEHTWKDATCTEPQTCRGCGKTTGDPNGHSYSSVVTAPAWTTQGYTTHTCSVCSDSYVDSYTEQLAYVKNWNLTLGGDLSVNFRMNIDSSVSTDAQIVVRAGTKSWEYKACDVYQENEDSYCVSATVAAAQMNEIITIQVVKDNEAYTIGEYTVLQYANKVLEDEEMGAYHNLVKAMLCYGGAAQTYFDYQTDKLVSDGIKLDSAEKIPEHIENAMTVSGKASGITFYGASLVFENKVAVRYYFTYSGELKDYNFSDDLTVVDKGSLCYVEIPGVNPQDLDEGFTVTVNDTLFVTYSPMNYIVRMYGKGSDSLKPLLEAMYQYYIAAEQLCSSLV